MAITRLCPLRTEILKFHDPTLHDIYESFLSKTPTRNLRFKF